MYNQRPGYGDCLKAFAARGVEDPEPRSLLIIRKVIEVGWSKTSLRQRLLGSRRSLVADQPVPH